ncbi:HET domain-containing protein [Microdochium nivale]|nr:HET domain-containing protein [Microdochium nivale]
MPVDAEMFLKRALEQAEEQYNKARESPADPEAAQVEVAFLLGQVLTGLCRLAVYDDAGLSRQDCIVKIAELVLEQPRLLLERNSRILFSPLLFIGDMANARIACERPWEAAGGPRAVETTINCDGCVAVASEQPCVFTCQSCWDKDLCASCHDALKSGLQLAKAGVRESCINHTFFVVRGAKASPMHREEVASLEMWLSSLSRTYSEKERPTSHNIHALDSGGSTKQDYEEAPINYQSNNITNQGLSLVARAELLAKDVTQFRSAWAIPRASRLLGQFFEISFPIHTRRAVSPDTNSTAEDPYDVFRRATAIVELALSPTSQVEQPTVNGWVVQEETQEARDARKSLYASIPLANDGKSIRVLRLLPGSRDAGLEGSLEVHDLETTSSSPFTALSYVWGVPSGPGDSFSIRLGERNMAITENLHHALRSLRSLHTPITLWVDALCINQGDDDEKSYQVGLMTHIYRQATALRIYLGDEGPRTDSLVEFVSRTRQPQESFSDILTRLSLQTGDVMAGYLDLCFRPWWLRVWVQQEHAMASCDPTFVLGQLSFSSLHFLVDATMLYEEASARLLPFQHLEIIDTQMSVPLRGVLRQLKHIQTVVGNRGNELLRKSSHGFQTPSTLLKESALLHCTDARDRIYGLRVFLDPVAQRAFYPNYKLSHRRVFEQLAAWVLIMDNCVDIYCWYPYKLPHPAPSWVPDFSRPAETMDEGSATQVGRPDEAIAIHGGILAIEAYVYDVVEDVVCLDEDDSWPQMASKIWQADCLHAVLPSRPQQKSMSPFLCALHKMYQKSSILPPGIQRDNMPRLLHDMHNTNSMCWWADCVPFRTMSIAEVLGLDTSSVVDAMSIAFDPVLKYVNSQLEQHGLSEGTSEQGPKSDKGWTQAWQSIKYRLVMLQFAVLKNSLEAAFVGPALFDFANFRQSLEALALPSRDYELARDKMPAFQGQLRSLISSIAIGEDCFENRSFGDGTRLQGFETDLSIVQNAVVDAACEQEVRLRGRIVLATALEVRRRAKASLEGSTSQTRAQGLVADFDPGPGIRPLQALAPKVVDFHRELEQAGSVTGPLTWLEGLFDPFEHPVARTNGGALAGLVSQMSINANERLNTTSSDQGAAAKSDRSPEATGKDVSRSTGHPPGGADDTTTATNGEDTSKRWISKFLDSVSDSFKTSFSRHGQPTSAVVRRSFETAFRGKTVLTTRHGFVAIGLEGVADIRTGDEIVLLKGAQYPLILRRAEQQERSMRQSTKEASVPTSPQDGPVSQAEGRPFDSDDKNRHYTMVGFANVRGHSLQGFQTLDKRVLPNKTVYRIV